MDWFSNEKLGMAGVSCWGRTQSGKILGNMKVRFSGQTNKRGGSYSEIFSNKECCTDLLRDVEVAGFSLEPEDSSKNTSPPGKSGPGCQCNVTVALF